MKSNRETDLLTLEMINLIDKIIRKMIIIKIDNKIIIIKIEIIINIDNIIIIIKIDFTKKKIISMGKETIPNFNEIIQSTMNFVKIK